VDICEDEKELCWKINVDSVDNLVSACELNNAHLIHLSTDFIFDGLSGPYDENAIANPLSFYGESKVASEKIVSNATCPWTIVRTVLVYGTAQNLSRSNIVLWAKSALEKGQIINVVNDQFRTPTLAEDLAEGCVKIAQQSKTGIYNISGDEFMSILELVERVANYFELTKENINVISSLTLNQAAKRPMITGFNIQKAIKDLAYSPVSFEQGLSIVKAQLKEI
jgi:dTDP-4-dehydrorhamnose reductase